MILGKMGDTELLKKDDWSEDIRTVKAIIDRLARREEVRNKPARILLVDDDESDVFLMRRELAKFKTDVQACHDSEEANRLIETEQFDFVFLDQKMPKLTGIEVLRKLNKSTQTKFFIVTGFSDSKLANEALQFGALLLPKASTEEEWVVFRKLLATFLKPKP